MSELKLLQAQVNPHFLFNALNTIIAVTRTDPARARELLVHLSHFFRKNLKRSGELSTLQEELEHVGAYLEIEKARFQDRLVVETDVDPDAPGDEAPHLHAPAAHRERHQARALGRRSTAAPPGSGPTARTASRSSRSRTTPARGPSRRAAAGSA